MRKITERRSNPDLNTGARRKDAYETVMQYVGREDAYLSMAHMEKVGIKPIFEHSTPIGIYAYPLAAPDVRKTIENKGVEGLPFRGGARFAHIILADIPDSRMLSVYTNADRWEQQLAAMAETEELQFLWPTIMEQAEEKMKKSDTGDRIIRAYQASRSLAFYMKMKRSWGLVKMAKMLDAPSPTDGEFEDFGAMSMWNAILRKSGFDAMTDEGIGYIHFHEESQTCFFHTRAFQNVITVELSTSDYPHQAKQIGSMAHLLRMVQNGLDPTETIHILDAMVRRRGTPHNYTEWSYKAGIHPTKGEVNKVMTTLKELHPQSKAKSWGADIGHSFEVERLWNFFAY